MEENLKSKSYGVRPHILVVDDDERIRSLVSRYLNEHDFVALEAAGAEQARVVLDNFAVDAMVLDVMMPDETGLEFTQSLRQDGQDIPVLLLTALGQVDDRIQGFEVGADDYLPKPFEPRELVMRLQAILRRSVVQDVTKEDASEKITFGGWVYDPDFDELCGQNNARVKLTEAEGALLRVLAQHAGEVLSRDVLAERCGLEGGGRTIDVQVTRLRRKIEEDTRAPRYLQTVRGKGYVLRVGR